MMHNFIYKDLHANKYFCPSPFFDEYCIWLCGSHNNNFHKIVVQQIMDSSLKIENIFIISFCSSVGNSPFLHHVLTQYRGDEAHHLETCSISVIQKVKAGYIFKKTMNKIKGPVIVV